MTQISILLENEDRPLNAESLGITMDSTPEQILEACHKIVLEETGHDIKLNGSFIYNVRKLTDKDTILLIPKTVAG